MAGTFGTRSTQHASPHMAEAGVEQHAVVPHTTLARLNPATVTPAVHWQYFPSRTTSSHTEPSVTHPHCHTCRLSACKYFVGLYMLHKKIKHDIFICVTTGLCITHAQKHTSTLVV
jgi:hypothetical protein